MGKKGKIHVFIFKLKLPYTDGKKCRRMETPTHGEVDRKLLEWFTQKSRENVSLGGSVLQQASEIGTKTEKKSFLVLHSG